MEFVITRENGIIELSEIIEQLEANNFDVYPLKEFLEKGT